MNDKAEQARRSLRITTKVMLGFVYDTLRAMDAEMQARIPTFNQVMTGLRTALRSEDHTRIGFGLWAPCESWEEVDARNEPLVVAMAVSDYGPSVPAYVTRFAKKLGLDLDAIDAKWKMLAELKCPEIGLRDFSEVEMSAATAAYAADDVALAREILAGMFTDDAGDAAERQTV